MRACSALSGATKRGTLASMGASTATNCSPKPKHGQMLNATANKTSKDTWFPYPTRPNKVYIDRMQVKVLDCAILIN